MNEENSESETKHGGYEGLAASYCSVNVKAWAEIDGERIEKLYQINIPLPCDGACPELTSKAAEQTSKALIMGKIKTGCDILPNEKAEAQCSSEVLADYLVIEAMRRWGGEFVRALAEAATIADSDNLSRIKAAWHEYWQQYSDMAKSANAKLNRTSNQT